MNMEQSIEILRQLIGTSLLVVSPILLGSLLVGLVVSLLQSVTSIQEQTLSFVPKLLAVSLVIVLGAPWILRQLMQFTITYKGGTGHDVVITRQAGAATPTPTATPTATPTPGPAKFKRFVPMVARDS